MTGEATTDVLICGAGAAGLALAIDLARRSVDFRLIEKAEAPFRGSRGKGLQPRSLEVFEDLGFVDRLFAVGGPYPPTRRYGPNGDYVDEPISDTPSAPTPAEPYRGTLMTPQFLTEALMRERLAELGAAPEFGRELTGFAQDGEGVVAEAGGETIRARFLVGADGGRSFVRSALGVGFPGKTLGARAIVADVDLEGLSRDVWHRFGAGGEQIMFCPLAGTDLFQVQAGAPLEGDVDLSAEGLTALAVDRTGHNIAIRSVAWASVYSMNARLADRYRVGRAFLVGDAAHVHPPTGGQGLNTSVQDSYNLGWKLAAALKGAPEPLLDTYEEERRPIAAGMLELSTRLLDEAKQGIRCGAAARRASSTSATPAPRSRCRRASGTASRRASGRRTRGCGAGPASRRACSRCSTVRTGRFWAARQTAAQSRPGPACAFMSWARAATSWTTAATFATPTASRQANGRSSGRTATSAP